MKLDPAAFARIRREVRAASARQGDMTHVPRIGPLDAPVFRALATAGVPFVIVGLVDRWPISRLTLETLVELFGSLRAQARVGDYASKAFSAARQMRALSLGEFVAGMSEGQPGLPPYLGNQLMPELAALCRWPSYFTVWQTPRVWLGPQGTVTPAHCDYVDNLFAQVWGTKRFELRAPHHAVSLQARCVNPSLYACFGPEADGGGPSSRGPWLRCDVRAGELLYLPAGWFHQVTALEVSLSVNRWTYDEPLALSRPQAGKPSPVIAEDERAHA